MNRARHARTTTRNVIDACLHRLSFMIRYMAPTRESVLSATLTRGTLPRGRQTRWTHPSWIAIAFGLLAVVFSIWTYELLNDHFDRLSRARQIARYGSLPFVDFFDPGYFLTEISSAALQRLLGDNLVGELLLNALFMGTGAGLVLLLSLRISQSNYIVAVTASILSVFAMPRAYDFDKVFFYPLGIWLVWRYIDHRGPKTLLLLAGGIVGASLFRYDNGIYILCTALVAVAIAHGPSRVFAARIGQLSLFLLVLGSPFAAFLQLNGGIVNAADQMVTYARREGARSRLTSLPIFSSGGVIGLLPSQPTGSEIQVRWSAVVDNRTARQILMARYALEDEQPSGAPEERLWSYRIGNTSKDNIRALVTSDFAEDTRGLDRQTFAPMAPDPIANRIYRAVPFLRVRLFPVGPEKAHKEAAAVLFWILTTLPVLALLALVIGARQQHSIQRLEIARVASLIVMVGLLDVFILRDPVSARVGGMAGPVAILFTWLAYRSGVTRRRLHGGGAWTIGVVTAVLLFSTLRVAGEWERRMTGEALSWPTVSNKLKALARTPANGAGLLNTRSGLVNYVHDCTTDTDRVFAAWFVPELYFFAQRGFAAGLPVTFGGHWSEPRFQDRSIQVLANQSVPLVFFETPSFPSDYASLRQYLEAHYRVDGVTNFGDSTLSQDHYTVLALRERQPTRVYPGLGLSCFA